MPSHLTRRVFQRLLSNHPLVVHRGFHGPTRPALRPRHARTALATVPTRAFMDKLQNIFNPKDRGRRKAYLDPGMEKMLELDKRIHLIARLPPKEELVIAFNAFVAERTKRRRAIEDFHAVRLLQTLDTMEKQQALDNSASVNRSSLKAALQAMAMVPDTGYTILHNKLAREIWGVIQNRISGERKVEQEAEERAHREVQQQDTDELKNIESEQQEKSGVPVTLIAILCTTGDAADARRMLESLGKPGPIYNGSRANSWAMVLMGFSRQNEEQEVRKTIEKMRDLNIEFSTNVARTLAVHYARHDNVKEAKKWYDLVDLTKPIIAHSVNSFTQDETVYQTLLEFCLRNREIEWGRNILTPKEGENSKFNKWDAIFRASAATGRSVNEIDRMMEVVAKRADENPDSRLRPNIDTFNGLIRFALSKNDAYLAERYFGLMDKWDVEPNAETYALQVEYRLGAGDLDGATAAYDELDDELAGNPDEKISLRNWTVMNKVLQATAAKPSSTQESFSYLLNDIAQTGLGLSFDTVAALTRFHVERDEYGPCADLLDNWAPQFSVSQRCELRDILFDFAMDPQTDVGRSWDAYMIFHQVFDLETQRDIRNKTMSLFFARARPDLGTHVFTQMSKHVRADTRPDRNTYIKAFEGIAAAPDPDALEVIHNLLKLDTDVEPNTQLLNALMLAYTATDLPVRALEFWHDIATSPEGPTYNSLRIALRACETSPFGYQTARQIWAKLRETDIEINKALFESYVACAARQRMFDDLKAALGEAKVITGQELDMHTAGAMFNACCGRTTQDDVVQYIRQAYPELWKELEANGIEESEPGWRLAKNIDRTLET